MSIRAPHDRVGPDRQSLYSEMNEKEPRHNSYGLFGKQGGRLHSRVSATGDDRRGVMTGDLGPKRLLILACSATKRRAPDPIPARDRYDGSVECKL
jgi:hypothetical protein